MYAITIPYKDYKGNEREEECLFDISPAELIEMQYSEAGGLDELIKKIISTKDLVSLSKMFKDLILKSYGQISPDGREFIKDPELAKHFTYTKAYSILYTRLASDDKAAQEFVNGIIPAEYLEGLKQKQSETK